MCGRFACAVPKSVIQNYYHVSVGADYHPHYNIAPGQFISVLRKAEGELLLQSMQWGFIPHWMALTKAKQKPINARIESANTSPMFRSAYLFKRCAVIASGFYEWKAEEHGKQPYYIHLKNQPIFTMAGLWSEHKNSQGDALYSCAIVTRNAVGSLKSIHERVPLIMDQADLMQWLDLKPLNLSTVLAHTNVYNDLSYYPISSKVNRAIYDSPDCIEPLS